MKDAGVQPTDCLPKLCGLSVAVAQVTDFEKQAGPHDVTPKPLTGHVFAVAIVLCVIPEYLSKPRA